eukprot:scaffold20579_cov92-Isochrysis_galbana.AAC.1
MLAPLYASPCIVHSATAHLASCIFIILHLARREEAGGQRAGSGGAQLGEQLAVEEDRKEGEGVLGEDEHQSIRPELRPPPPATIGDLGRKGLGTARHCDF